MGYIVLLRSPGRSVDAFEAMATDLLARGWRKVAVSRLITVFLDGGAPPTIAVWRPEPRIEGVLIGEVFDRAATDLGQVSRFDLSVVADATPLEAADLLIRRAWGQYVFVGQVVEDAPVILRDPSGALAAYVWTREAVTVVASHVVEGRAGPAELAIDWTRLGQILADPVNGGFDPPLIGVMDVRPGAARHGVGARQVSDLWSPARVVRASAGAASPGRETLRARVDACVAALAGTGTVACEISGGLDSAIVATSLKAVGRTPAATVNFYRVQAESDERRYAQAVADEIGAPLRVVRRDPFVLDLHALNRAARCATPNFNALDFGYDEGLIETIETSGAQVLFTGHGGDVVFFQLAAPELAADLMTGGPCEGSRLARLAELARRTRRSVWSLGREALSGRSRLMAPPATPGGGVIKLLAKPKQQAWLADDAGLSRAKRRQVAALAAQLYVNGATGRAEKARIAHPLLAQPVVETCLAIPATILSSGEQERSFAREAFADRVPASVLERRAKGEINVFMGQTLARSIDVLRPLLLDGVLVRKGWIDAAAMEAALTPESMVWKDRTLEILTAATLEAWVRHWEGRVAAVSTGADAPLEPAKASSRKAKART